MDVITVKLPTDSYDIRIAPGQIDRLGEDCRGLKLGKKAIVVSNPQIFKHYGARTLSSLQEAGFQVETCILPAGERFKHLGSIQKIYDRALECRLERSSTLFALGGGVIGDMTGFAAATWLRGINFVQVPTTLLAMVDSSVGGKTGVNHPHGKNLIGAFYQPRLVSIDPTVLQTLAAREFRAGMAEVIKYGIIWDLELFEMLEKAGKMDRLGRLSAELLQMIIIRSCEAKAAVVGEDEKEAGLRAILNYGHTIGHAIESLTGYRQINHGEGVSIGMVAAGKLAANLGFWPTEANDRQDRVLHATGLPEKLPLGIDIDEIVAHLQLDKKVRDGRVRFILPTEIGKVNIVDTPTDADVKKALLSM
jgi:3-dehydroquinate synthase